MTSDQAPNQKRRNRVVFVILAAVGGVVISMNACSDFMTSTGIGSVSSSSLNSSAYASASIDDLKNSCAVTTDDAEPTPLRRLTTDEYQATIRDVLQCPANCLSYMSPYIASYLPTVPADVQHDGIATFVRFSNLDQAISPERLTAYHNIALQVAEFLKNVPSAQNFLISQMWDSCYNGADSQPDACVTKMLKGFAFKAWRRPATDDQVAAIRGAMTSVTGFKAQLGQAAYYILMAPDFVFHLEMDGSRTGQILKLDSYAVASKISFLLIGRDPDAELYRRAAAGKLQSPDEIASAVDYVRATYPSTVRDNFWKFTREWLNVSTTAFTTGPEPETFSAPDFSVYRQGAQVRSEMNNEVRAMMEYYVFDKPDTYKTLLTNQNSFAKGTIVPSLYGVAEWDGVSAPPSHPQGQRAGFLTTASILTSGGTTTRPFITGGLVHKHILCREFGDAPEPAMLPGLDTSTDGQLVSTRTRFEQLVPRGSSCMACHSSIEGVGMPFQAYDVFGRFRNGQERIVNASGTQMGFVPVDSRKTAVIDNVATPVADGVDLITKIASTSEPQACFAKQYLRYANARKDGVRDSCTEYRFASRLQTGTVWDAMKSYISDDWFSKRRMD